MFVSCGYDTPEVIAEMDVNQSACDRIYIRTYLHCIYICIDSPIKSFSCNSMYIYVVVNNLCATECLVNYKNLNRVISYHENSFVNNHFNW